MKGKLMLALCVCLALTEYSAGREVFSREYIQDINQNEVSSEDDNFPDEMLKMKRRKDTKAASCFVGTVVYDKCGRRCQCENGNVVKCCRIRKEFTSMTHEERVRYTNTVFKATMDSAYKTEYDGLLLGHKHVFYKGVHTPKVFLPWHRWYLLQYEDLLRRVDCRVTVPYWDWSAVAADPWSSSMWNTGNDGFGGDGDPNADYCVKNGPFRDPVWSFPLGNKTACLKRIFQQKTEDAAEKQPELIVPGREAVDDLMMIEASNMTEFLDTIEHKLHDDIHGAINGTMHGKNAAYAPEFYLHHGFIDKLWWDWQSKGDEYMYQAFFNDQTEKMIGTSYYPREFLNLHKMPGDVCAAYEDKNAMNLKAKWKTKFQPLRPISPSAIRLFGVKTDNAIRIRQNRERPVPATRRRYIYGHGLRNK